MKPRHPFELKTKVANRRREGESLKRLVVEFGLPKSTIQGWIASITLSQSARNRIDERAKEQRRGVRSNRRLALPSTIYFTPFSPDLIRFFAHCLFDGSIRHDQVIYYSSHLALAEKFADNGQKIFGLKPKWGKKEVGVLRVHFFSRNLAEFLLSRRKFLFENIGHMDRDHQLEFLKAFFNDEGSVTYREESGKKAVRGYQKDVDILRIVASLLQGLGIDSRLESLEHSPEIAIRGRENIEKFAQFIGFDAGVSFLATRKNSYYPKPIEKRIVLRQLIASYH